MKATYRRACECEGAAAMPLPQVDRSDYDGLGDRLEVSFQVVCGECFTPYEEEVSVFDWSKVSDNEFMSEDDLFGD